MPLPIIPIAMGLAQAIPSIVGLFKGKKAAENAQAVVDIAKTITGHEDPEKAVDAIVTDPKLVVELKAMVLNFILEDQRMYLEDVQNARESDVEKVKITGSRDVNMYLLAWAFVVGFFGTTVMLLILVFMNKVPDNIPSEMWLMIGSLSGTLNAGVMAILQYFFGSSKSSSDKTMMMAEMKK